MTGIEYMDFYQASDTEDAYKVLKESKNAKVQNDDYCQFFIQQNKLKSIFIEKEKNSIDILHILFKKLIECGKVNLDEIDYLFFCRNPYGLMEGEVHLPYYLIEKYKMNNATVINMFQECSTTMQAFELADSLIKTKKARKIMVVTLCLTDGDDYERFIETSILGDGAGILVFGDNAALYELTSYKSMACGKYSFQVYQNEKYSPMETIKITSQYMKEFIETEKLTQNDIGYIVPQNLSYSNIHLMSKFIEFDISKFFLKNLEHGGHLADVDTVRNLLDIQKDESLETGSNILMYSVGNIRPGMDFVFNMMLLKKL